ncbi:hypothetical protein DSO57_1022844 [Entomophthora muscae]|uniref:Uncharacterized protein n=1 Tax=Entomophthora muscae TaxID=34485 RepID=A0ACC2S5J2_9FUNG|nr:hypothetical protein DSO57_1022844 [Entomophthora muscae]
MLFQSAALLFTVAQAAPAYAPVAIIAPYVTPSITAVGSSYNQYSNTQTSSSSQYAYANTGTSNYNTLQTPQTNINVVNAAGTNYVATANQSANSRESGINANTYINTISPEAISNVGSSFAVSQSSGSKTAAAQVINGNFGINSITSNTPTQATQNIAHYSNTIQAGSDSASNFNQGDISASTYDNFMNDLVNSQTGTTTGANYGSGQASSSAYADIDASTNIISTTQNAYHP